MIYEVKFDEGQQSLLVTAEFDCVLQDRVVVKSDRGQMMGSVTRIYETDELEVVGQILRRAGEADLVQLAQIQEDSKEARGTIEALIAENGLSMTIEKVAYTLDYAQLFISFTAEKRVDFRQLLRDLSEAFHTRIELRQIGARDAAALTGGLGPCGRPLCCASFLYEFPTVSIKMAKNQQLSFNQGKVNGLCGRLMCCLAYEDDFYKEASREFPDFGDHLDTPDGQGRVVGMNILARTVKLRFEDMVREYKLEELEEAVHG